MEENKGKTVQEAFAELIRRASWYKPLGLSEPAANALASRFRSGEKVSLDKIREVLQISGEEGCTN
jgi:hypothetical protein